MTPYKLFEYGLSVVAIAFIGAIAFLFVWFLWLWIRGVLTAEPKAANAQEPNPPDFAGNRVTAAQE